MIYYSLIQLSNYISPPPTLYSEMYTKWRMYQSNCNTRTRRIKKNLIIAELGLLIDNFFPRSKKTEKSGLTALASY